MHSHVSGIEDVLRSSAHRSVRFVRTLQKVHSSLSAFHNHRQHTNKIEGKPKQKTRTKNQLHKDGREEEEKNKLQRLLDIFSSEQKIPIVDHIIAKAVKEKAEHIKSQWIYQYFYLLFSVLFFVAFKASKSCELFSSFYRQLSSNVLKVLFSMVYDYEQQTSHSARNIA